ncbi:MAG: hypothetical protein SOH93_01845 [Oscillospiraceae bacterium]|jgi:hypothetical protein|nr:conserved protein of unknown function [Ruminococcaceae bacterium BL-4]
MLHGMIMPPTDPERKLYQIWINKEEKIASFHEIEGGELTEFKTSKLFQFYLDNLVSHLYRFQ